MILDSLNKFYSLLSKNQIFKVISLIILLIIGMILEILGIGILIPTLEIISNPESFLSNDYFSKLVHYFNFKDLNQFSIILFSICSNTIFYKNYFFSISNP